MFQHTSQDNLTGQVYNDLRQRLNECGIGFTGIDGVWWRPACEPFELSIGLAQQLGEKDLVVLDRCLPLTILLTGESFNKVFDEQDDWVVKYAAYNGANQTGGGPEPGNRSPAHQGYVAQGVGKMSGLSLAGRCPTGCPNSPSRPALPGCQGENSAAG